MNHEDGFFKGIKDTKLFYQKWSPDAPKGVVLVAHGYGEHSGRYMNVVDALLPEGYAVYALDHRGHGKSEGRRCHADRFTDLLDDLSIFEDIARKENPELPFHLIGHSMGSIIANHFMAGSDQSKFKSLVLSGTGAAPGPAITTVTRLMSKVFSAILPKISIPAGLDPQFISHDPKVVEDYINDPLVETKITPRLGNELMIYVSNMIESAERITVPTLMQIGSEDDAFSPESWEGLYASFDLKDKDFKKYDGMRHEVYNEVEKEIVLNDLKDWLNKFN